MQLHIRGWMWATVAFLAMPPAPSQTIENFFDGSKLQELRLTMAPADWEKLKQNYLEDTYYKADFEWNGITIRTAGIKSRGSGSRNPIKPSVTINFGKYNSPQRLLGLKSIVLRNFWQDPSMTHERLTMEMFQKLGLPYERETHAKLFVNGEYVGLYLVVEPLDERFTLTRFDESDGYLYEYNWNGEPFYFNYLGDDPALYCPGIFEAKTHENDPQAYMIADMVRTANFASDEEFPTAIQKYIDLGAFIAHAAAEQFMAEGDGILTPDGMRNFYLYRRLADDRFFLLVWDKEMTFTVTDLSIWSGTEQNVLMRRALAVPEIKQRYLETLMEAARIAGGPGGWLEQAASRILDQIRSAVAEDPSRVCVIGDKTDHCPLEMFEQAASWVDTFAQSRSSFVEGEVKAAGMTMAEPMLVPGQAMNAASLVAELVPGSLACIDTALAVPGTIVAQTFPLPGELSGVSVKIGGLDAPILGVGPTRAVVQVPWELSCGPTSLEVRDSGRRTNTISVEVRPSSPGIFAVTHADGTPVDVWRPAEPGEVVSAFTTGLGYTRESQTNGEPPAGTPEMEDAVTALIGGAQAHVLWAGLSPGFVGLQQVNLEIPTDAASGSAVELRLMVNGEVGGAYALAIR